MKILIYYMPIYFLLLFVVSFYFVVYEKNKKILEQYQAEAQHCSSLSSRTAPAHWPFSSQLRARPKRLRPGRPIPSHPSRAH